MKFNFKKITAVATSALMLGMSMGVAAAANYPAPFVSGGSANVAIVYGTGTGVLSSDIIQAGNIQTNLQAAMGSASSGTSSTTSTNSNGEVYSLEKTSTKFHLGDYVGDVVSTTITDDNLPTILADGKYIDDNNDEFDYTQKITLNNATLQLRMFEDNDYKSDTPTVGIRIPSGSNVLNYTLDFSDEPYWSNLATTDFPFMGKTYYVLSTSGNNTITLLDSAADATITEGESKTVTVNGTDYNVSIDFVGESSVKLVVNGETTNSLSEGGTYKLNDGSYVGIKDIMYTSKDSGVSKVEFSIGAGKLVLTDGSDIELNEDTISGLSVNITNDGTTKLDKIKVIWEADDDLFVTNDSTPTMPGFKSIQFGFGGMVYPSEEAINVESGGDDYAVLKNFPLKDTTETIHILYYNGSAYTMIGKDSDNLLRTSGTSSLTFDGDTDDYFVASWTDGSDAESYLMRAKNFVNTSGTQKADIEYKKGDSWITKKSGAESGDQITLGNVVLNIGTISKDDKTVVITAGTNVNFNTLYSKEGMKVYLPWINATSLNETGNYSSDSAACNNLTSEFTTFGATALGYSGSVTYNVTSEGGAQTTTCTSFPATYTLRLTEEDKNGNIASGGNINLTLGADTNSEVSVTGVSLSNGGSSTEIGDSKIYRNFVYSDLATEIKWDKSADQYKVGLTYHGSESYGKAYIGATGSSITVSGSSSTSTSTPLGYVLVKDTEVNSVKDKNLIVVGGSCINSVAAHLLGGAYCGSSFTEKTGVGSGQFLIQSFGDAYTTGKIALLVAGYNAADTVNAAGYLTTKTVDTTAGKKYKGTSATSAELVTTTTTA